MGRSGPRGPPGPHLRGGSIPGASRRGRPCHARRPCRVLLAHERDDRDRRGDAIARASARRHRRRDEGPRREDVPPRGSGGAALGRDRRGRAAPVRHHEDRGRRRLGAGDPRQRCRGRQRRHGCRLHHEALVEQYRGNLGGAFDHNYSWWDPTGICGDEPCDNAQHGTHTMGTMVGGDGPGPFTPDIGVAPGARWIAAKGCEDLFCSESSLLSSGSSSWRPRTWTATTPTRRSGRTS